MMMVLAFEGSISLENNGGFSSVRYRFQKIQVKEYTLSNFKEMVRVSI
jgi:starvation-inducible outer membrane lipoprotein